MPTDGFDFPHVNLHVCRRTFCTPFIADTPAAAGEEVDGADGCNDGEGGGEGEGGTGVSVREGQYRMLAQWRRV